MSEDVVSMLESMAVGSDDEPEAIPKGMAAESLPRVFCKQLHNLLTILQDVFPENEKLSSWVTMFEVMVLDKPDMEEWVVKKWHFDMTHGKDGERIVPDLYKLTRERRIDEVLSSDLWVFKEIEARDLYFHPDLDENDRESLCKHFDQINSYARIYAALPDGMREAIERVTAKIDPTQEITHDTMTNLLQTILSGPDANMEQLMSWSTQLVSSFADGSGLDAIQTLMTSPMVAEATGGLDMSKLMGTLNSELAGGLNTRAMPALDPSMLMKCMSMLGMGGGSGGAGAGSS